MTRNIHKKLIRQDVQVVEEEEIGITLNEVYERLEQLDSDGAEVSSISVRVLFII
jgi:hypothetical protein